MRLWTLHPQYLDAQGLVALWREALLAQKVLCGLTRGYRHHPQLARFRELADPVAGIASYLAGVHAEAERRGYRFDAGKIRPQRWPGQIEASTGQLDFEWRHLRAKLALRNPDRLPTLPAAPLAHPLFRLVPGGIAPWEKT